MSFSNVLMFLYFSSGANWWNKLYNFGRGHNDGICQGEMTLNLSQWFWSRCYLKFLYPRHLCRRVYSFRFYVRSFILPL